MNKFIRKIKKNNLHLILVVIVVIVGAYLYSTSGSERALKNENVEVLIEVTTEENYKQKLGIRPAYYTKTISKKAYEDIIQYNKKTAVNGTIDVIIFKYGFIEINDKDENVNYRTITIFKLGLTEEEMSEISEASRKKFNETLSEIKNDLKSKKD